MHSRTVKAFKDCLHSKKKQVTSLALHWKQFSFCW